MEACNGWTGYWLTSDLYRATEFADALALVAFGAIVSE